MPVLKHPKLEKFLHNIIEGMDYGHAWTAAGHKATGNAAQSAACRALRRDEVKERYGELMAPAARAVIDLREAARQYTQAALDTLESVMNDEKAPHAARVAAANSILDRGHGKAVQHIEAEISVYDSLSLAEKQVLLAALDTLDGDEESDSGGVAPTH
jgi:hypothetical protein